MSYLIDLAMRLAAGAVDWPWAFREPHVEYLLGQQRDDGGFAGRQGPSDLYYTSFALRGLALLGALQEPAAHRAADFLRSRLGGKLPGVELYSLVFAAVLLGTVRGRDVLTDGERTSLAAAIDGHRHPDGGYAKSRNNPNSSTYHTFLAVLGKQALGVEADLREPIVELLRSRRRDGGGFVEIPQMRASGTNPTAAAVVGLSELGSLDASTQRAAARFLASMQNEEGGFRANTRIPVADLLSTFTALTVLAEGNGLSRIDHRAAADYARSLARATGGFLGGAWDDAADVEYTFYGLGTLALSGG